MSSSWATRVECVGHRRSRSRRVNFALESLASLVYPQCLAGNCTTLPDGRALRLLCCRRLMRHLQERPIPARECVEARSTRSIIRRRRVSGSLWASIDARRSRASNVSLSIHPTAANDHKASTSDIFTEYTSRRKVSSSMADSSLASAR